jgi:hypothetical protein
MIFMEYSSYILASGCLLGILTHVLLKINAENKKTGGAFSFHRFIALEWASISISVVVGVAAVVGRSEIAQLKQVGGWLFWVFYGIGLTSQYIAYKFNGAAKRKVDQILSTDDVEGQ